MTKKKVNCDYELLCLLDGKVKNSASYGHYTTLKLKKEDNPSLEEIKKAYQQLALKWNPDKIKQQESREPTKDEKNKWHEIEIAYSALSNPEKRQKYDAYDGKNKYEKMIIDMENIMGKENLKIEEKNWKPAERKKGLTGEGNYILFYFNSAREKVKKLKEEVLDSISNQGLLGRRYLLLNLTDETKIKTKIKLIKKTNKLQPNQDVK